MSGDTSDEAMSAYPLAKSPIPPAWEQVTLTQIAVDLRPGFASGKHNAEGAGVAHLRPMNVDRDGQIDLQVVKSVLSSNDIDVDTGDVLFNNTNSPELVGKTAVVPFHAAGSAFSNHMTRIRLERDVDPRYIARQLHFLWMTGYMKRRCTNHVNQASISTTTLATSIPIRLAPAAEQVRIVLKLEELLSDLDNGVSTLKQAQKKLQQYRQSVLKAAVEGALSAGWREQNPPTETGAALLAAALADRRARWETKQLAEFEKQVKTPPTGWRDKYPEPVAPDTANLPALPQGWTWASVDQCSLDESAITDGPFGSNLKSEHYQKSGPRVLRLQNIGDGVFVDAKAHIADEHYQKLRKHAVEEGDVVVAMLGESLPRACVVPSGVAPAIVKADCARVRLNTAVISPSLLVAHLSSKPVRDIVAKSVKGIGRPRINLGHIRAIPIALCPKPEQAKIDALLAEAQGAIDDQGAAIEKAFAQSGAQRQNIMRAAFTGSLVPQDPNEEPASALLERIDAERLERAKPAKEPGRRKEKSRKEKKVMAGKITDVLEQAGGWLHAQEAFRRCGVIDGSRTDQIEALYAELRELDKAGRLAVEPVLDEQGRKIQDRLKLKTA